MKKKKEYAPAGQMEGGLVKKEPVSRSEIWDPFGGMRSLRNQMANLFEDFFDGRRWGTRLPARLDWDLDLEGGRTWFPAIDVEETDKEYVFTAEVPGLEKDDVHVEIDHGVLKIRGEKKEHKEEKGRNFIRREQYAGDFCRTFSLPKDAKEDAINASYKNGVLTVKVGRSEAEKPKSIPVQTDDEKK